MTGDQLDARSVGDALSGHLVYQLNVLDSTVMQRRPGLTPRQSTGSGSSRLDATRSKGSKRASIDHNGGLGERDRRTVWPKQDSNALSWLFFAWVTPLLRLGHQRPLELDDIWIIPRSRSSEVLSRKVNVALDRHTAGVSLHPLRAALLEVFKVELLAGGVAQLLSTFIHALTPFALRYLIAFATSVYNETEKQPLSRGVGIVLAIASMQLLQSLCTNHSLHYSMLVGAQARSALTALILQKSMKLSPRAKAAASDGTITNLMSTDTARIDQACSTLHPVWTAPISIFLSLTLLYFNLSYGAFCGFMVLAIATPLVTRAMKLALARRSKITNITDSRVTLAQELLQGMKFIKIFGWETAFLERHHGLRKQEVRTLRSLIDLRNTVMSASMAIPIFAAAPSFALYSYLADEVTPARIFSSIGLLNSLRQPLGVLPSGTGQLLDASISISRIEHFLLAEEADDTARFDPEAGYALMLANASFAWEGGPQKTSTSSQQAEHFKSQGSRVTRVPFERSSSLESQQFTRPLHKIDSSAEDNAGIFTLKDLSVIFNRNELVAVVGDVAAGKSSFLAALAGHMRKTAGEVIYGATKAYCAEGAWIQNSSIRDNITFGQPFDDDLYNQVIEACSLTADLDGLAGSDLTEVGERGVTLSGGQKQRINIARAIYSGAGVLLMDDPLSAVDAHVGHHIFTKAILGLLRGKCRIIATHQTQILPACDKIIRLQNGRIASVEIPDQSTRRTLQRQLSFGPTKKRPSGLETGASDAATESSVAQGPSSLMQVEERPTRGGVPSTVYAYYLTSTGTQMSAMLVLGLLALLQSSIIGGSIWLSFWTSRVFDLPDSHYLGIYATLGIIQAALMFFFCKSITYLATNASFNVLEKALTSVVHSPMSFFDTTPIGRLINRFSKDADTLDNTLADSIRLLLMTTGSTISVFILIVSYYRLFIFAILPVIAAYLSYTAYYRSSAREMKFHESTVRSKVFAQFGEAITGVYTIKSYGVQDRFVDSILKAIDDMNSAYILSFSYQRWLAIRLDGIGLILVIAAGLLAVRSSTSVDPSVIGIVVAWIVSVAQMLQFTIRYLTDVDRDMVSVERLQHYGTRLVKEEQEDRSRMEVPASWPAKGEIVFDKACLRYREGLPEALRDFNLHIRPGERIGIVGRTGAGKSTILTALLRLVNLSSGKIFVDGIDISQIALADLRSRITVVTQDPKLFRGTMRSNLDPFDEHTDAELLLATQRVHLQDQTQGGKQQGGLNLTSIAEEDGKNLSFGQRQLLVLARALVRHTQITIFDEATTAIDLETDEKIQQTIAEAFTGRTLMCIAHRLKTVISFDRICVLDAGQIAELDSPKQLWLNNGLFRRLCDQSGIVEKDFA